MKLEQKAILDAINIVVRNRFKELCFNYYIDGLIVGVNSDGTYNVKSSNNIFNNIRARTGLTLQEGDAVQVMIKNGEFTNKFIDDKL